MKVKELIGELFKLDMDKEIEYFLPNYDFQTLEIERIIEYEGYCVIQ